MTRQDALHLVAEMVDKVRAAPDPANLARAAVLPLEIRQLFTVDEVREVASFLYLMKRRTRPADADFVADQLQILLQRLETTTADPTA